MLRAIAVLPLLVVAAATATPFAARPAGAAFPGENGPIAFTYEAPAGDHTQSDIYVLPPGKTTPRPLTSTPNRNEFGPAYSPDGRRIAYWRSRAPFGPGSLWVMDVTGAHKTQLTRGFDARDPAWSPDATRLVFTAASKAGASFDLWVLRLRDGRLTRLTRGPALDFEPAWSPDGKAIAFTRAFEQGDSGDLYTLDVASRATTRVTHHRAYDHQVGWSPAGDRLVFERDFDTRSFIITVAVDGTGLARLTNGRSFDDGPAYSPDGTRIAFGSDRGGGLGDLWMMDADGSRKRRIAVLEYAEGFPDWSVQSD